MYPWICLECITHLNKWHVLGPFLYDRMKGCLLFQYIACNISSSCKNLSVWNLFIKYSFLHQCHHLKVWHRPWLIISWNVSRDIYISILQYRSKQSFWWCKLYLYNSKLILKNISVVNVDISNYIYFQVLYTDAPVVMCAPTGSGKTAIFELAIIRLIMKKNGKLPTSHKIVYSKLFNCFCSLYQ